MSQNRAPAFQFYPDKALAGTLHLKPIAFRAYWRIVWWMWLHSDDYCSISAEVNAICTASGLSRRQYKNVWECEIMPEHHPMFKVVGNKLVCNGLRKEALKQKRRRRAARKAAFAKHSQSKRTADALRSACTPTPSPILSLSKEDKGELNDTTDVPMAMSGAESSELSLLTNQFIKATKWTGQHRTVFDFLRKFKHYYPDVDVSDAITQHAKPLMKPWDWEAAVVGGVDRTAKDAAARLRELEARDRV